MEESTPLPSPASSCGSSRPQDSTFDQDLAIDMQLKCMIKCNLPFSDTFTKFSQKLQPQYKGVSTTSLHDRAVKHYVRAKKDLIIYFENYQSKVSLTVYQWKTTGGYYNVPYTCVTCHWIDRETWKISKRIISLEQYELDLDEVILESLSEFNLKGQVMSVSVDDSDGFYQPTMTKLKTEMNPMFEGVLFHTKCVSRILNSMVKSSLDHVAPVIKKFEGLFNFIFMSHENKFEKFVRAKGAKVPYMLRNLPYQWNTTYTMLRRMVKQKLLIVEYYASFDEKKIDIDDTDWEIIESLLGILKVFRSSTMRLSSDAYYPTSPLVLGEILLISHMMKEYKQSVLWEPVIRKMQSKFLGYYRTMPEVFTCAAALNPRIGIGGVENILEDIEGNFGINKFATASTKKCSETLSVVFDYYDKMHRSRGGETAKLESRSGSRNLILESVSRKKSRTLTNSNELELYNLYTNTNFLNVMSDDEYEKFDMLEWWGSKGRHQFPILAEMAGDLLSVQASTIPFEFAFCLNGRVLDEETSYKMSQLDSPKWYEIRIFLKEDFDSSDGKQNLTLVDDDDVSEYDECEDDEGDEEDDDDDDDDECEDDDDDDADDCEDDDDECEEMN
ncbi:hypothetical protein LXL04_038059 [Taraxacum kok-saghyz]